MNFIVGTIVVYGSILGGYAAMGGYLVVLWQPWELVMIGGSAIGTFIIANPMYTIKDTIKAISEAIMTKAPDTADYLSVLGLLHSLMRELKSKGRNEVEKHIDDPASSDIFERFESVQRQIQLRTFICDYFRLIIIGNARTHEIEALMDEELQTIAKDKMKSYYALVAVAEALPALGIVAAVLGVIKAMGALDQSPELLGALIGAALVGTFVGIFLSYGVVTPIANKVKLIRDLQSRPYVIVKQTLLAFMNGAMPQVAAEYGRKTIPGKERPTIDAVEESMNQNNR